MAQRPPHMRGDPIERASGPEKPRRGRAAGVLQPQLRGEPRRVPPMADAFRGPVPGQEASSPIAEDGQPIPRRRVVSLLPRPGSGSRTRAVRKAAAISQDRLASRGRRCRARKRDAICAPPRRGGPSRGSECADAEDQPASRGHAYGGDGKEFRALRPGPHARQGRVSGLPPGRGCRRQGRDVNLARLFREPGPVH